MKILAYCGTSWPSLLIRLQTRSRYSHVAVEMDDGTVIEAWAFIGVRHVADKFEAHKAGTVIESFEITGDCDQAAVASFLRSQLGKKYDYRSLVRFITRRNTRLDDKWFCSELVLEAFRRGGLELLMRIPASHATPRDIIISPFLRGPVISSAG